MLQTSGGAITQLDVSDVQCARAHVGCINVHSYLRVSKLWIWRETSFKFWLHTTNDSQLPSRPVISKPSTLWRRSESGEYNEMVKLRIKLAQCPIKTLRTRKDRWVRSQQPRALRRGSMTARLIVWGVRGPPETWMSVSCECCVLSGRGLCDWPIPRPEESYGVCLCCLVWLGAIITLYSYNK